MGQAALRLRVDPPYPGESLSSFLGRTAQFYGTPVLSLVRQLLGVDATPHKGVADLDLNPPLGLEERLAESVIGWRSPLADHRGFHSVSLGRSWRHAYCPRCFEEDLDAGRTPYFRNDWIPFFVTTCWKHGSLLFSWEDVNHGGCRRLPRAWLYQLNHRSCEVPAFFRSHCEWLRKAESSGLKGYVGLNVTEVVGYLSRLQLAVEKTSASPMPCYSQGGDPNERIRLYAKELALTAVRYLWGENAPAVGVDGHSLDQESFEYVAFPCLKRRPERALPTLRRASRIQWRRACVLFVARTLAGTEEFGRWISVASDREPYWRQWWTQEFSPHMGGTHRKVFIELMKGTLGRQLDGLDLPGRSARRAGGVARQFGRNKRK